MVKASLSITVKLYSKRNYSKNGWGHGSSGRESD
jgi:hypothetical protein